MSPARRLVAGIDSSTQSCKVAIVDAASGELVRAGAAPHPTGTAVDPEAWWTALQQATAAAGGLDDVAAVSVGAQQHGMVCLGEDGSVVRDALLWNDTRSADAAAALTAELPGRAAGWAEAVGSVLVPSFTVTKLRWLAEHEPANLARTLAVCLPHDWLTWRLAGATSLDTVVTDRSDASGTGYWSASTGAYRPDLLELACGRALAVPDVLPPTGRAGALAGGDIALGCGAGDNAASALGLGLTEGDVLISLGTSGVAAAVAGRPTADPSGDVAGFADATGRFLPLVCTLNATRVFDAAAALLGVDLDTLSELALAAPAGADGLVVVPYWEGERTPNRPRSTGAIHGLRPSNSTRADFARAAVEGVLCGLADGVDALRVQGVPVRRAVLVGGGARSSAVASIAAGVLALPVQVPDVGESVARGAARQAAWLLDGSPEPPQWAVPTRSEVEPAESDHAANEGLRDRYATARELTVER